MNRRQFVTRAGALPAAASALRAQTAAKSKSTAPDEHAMPENVASYLARSLNRLAAKWDQKRAQIKTPSDTEARNRFVRKKVIEMIGGFPERNPLEAKTVKVIERPGYRIENVIFQSRPNFWVTGNLYVPTSGAGRLPAIISPCGHYPLARMLPQYQLAYQNLVKNGFIVLAYDPIGQGERRQYWNPQTGVTEVGGPTDEHSMPGQLLFLLGENLTQYLVWDGMRAIDYLLARPEVDPERIGCAGHSGGGTLTKFISAVDERVKCAVIHEGGTRNRWPIHLTNFTPLGPSDVEQNIFPSAIYGVDHVDLHVAIAPRPLMATIEHYAPDFNAAADQIRSRYQQLGVPGKFATVSADDPHAWTFKLRLATTDWFSRWFYNRPGPTSEPVLTPERPEDLYCTPNGSLRYSQQGETIWSIILKKQAKLPPAIETPVARDVASYRENLCTRIRELLRYRKFDQPLSPRHVGTTPHNGYKVEKLEFLSEPGISVPVWVFIPEKRRPGSTTILYFNEAGMAADGMEFAGSEGSSVNPGVLAQVARNGNLVIAADVRGVGETRPSNRPASSGAGEFRHLFDTETALSYMAWYADQSLFGMRVQDVIRTVDYALSRPDANSQSIRVIGKDMAALWVLYAAALDPRIAAVVCHQGLLSYHSLASADRYLHGANIFVPHVLEHFDLTHVAAAVSGRRAVLLSPVDAMKRPVDIPAAQESYRWTQEIFAIAGAAGQFQILAYNPDHDLADQYLQLLSGDPA